MGQLFKLGLKNESGGMYMACHFVGHLDCILYESFSPLSENLSKLNKLACIQFAQKNINFLGLFFVALSYIEYVVIKKLCAHLRKMWKIVHHCFIHYLCMFQEM